MIQIGVYGVGCRCSARRKVSFCIEAIFARRAASSSGIANSLEAAVEERANRLAITRIEVEIVMAEARKGAAFHRATPAIGETVGVMLRDDVVGIPREEERRGRDRGSEARGIERMAKQPRNRQPWIDLRGHVASAREGRRQDRA